MDILMFGGTSTVTWESTVVTEHYMAPLDIPQILVPQYVLRSKLVVALTRTSAYPIL